MQKFHIPKTLTTPEIYLVPEENLFYINGTSSPEDVRALYYPVIEWINIFIDDIMEGEYKTFNSESPVKFQIDLEYFNSSSAKFLFDILTELKRLPPFGVPVQVEWYFDEEDQDMKDAGNDISLLVGMEFIYIAKSKNS